MRTPVKPACPTCPPHWITPPDHICLNSVGREIGAGFSVWRICQKLLKSPIRKIVFEQHLSP